MSDLWLKHTRQEGLVVASAALNDVPLKQTKEDTEAFKDCADVFWEMAKTILQWPDNRVAKGADLPDAATCRLTEMSVTLKAQGALTAPDDDKPRLLIRILEDDQNPDQKGLVEGWAGITAQQAFERHLRESGVKQGLLVSNDVLRLTYAPVGETPGYLEWQTADMGITAGRDMLAGLKLVLGKNAIWGSPESSLSGILSRSRESQNKVSEKLAGQVLGALYTLLRGFTSELDSRLKMREVAERQPELFYEGLLTVLLRLVFILYAEDRDLLPSLETPEAQALYDQGYSLRNLFGQLEADKALYPDTMADRYGAWGRILGLFKLVYEGSTHGFMHQRRGKLFDPKVYPFLLGQFDDGDEADVLPVSDKCIHEVLRQLLILDKERLSYKTLDVEQIGSVYETVMGFTVDRAMGESIALKVGKGGVPAYLNLDKVLEAGGAGRKKFILDSIGYKLTDKQSKEVKAAANYADILSALDRAIDERASPYKRACDAGTIILQPTDERRNSGSHYTPRSLTEPIVKEALEPILKSLGTDAKPDDVLALKVCDPAMGSGAFLVETCRALGERLQVAWQQYPDLLPKEAREDPEIYARREVAKRCLYGVDRNPMATDLAKLSLWLVTLSRDEDFSFLDHAFKSGDSLVGLGIDQIKGMTWGDPEQRFMFASSFDKAVEKAISERRHIRNASDNVTFQIQMSRHKIAEKELDNVRRAGDAVIGAFFEGTNAKTRKAVLDKLQDGLGLGGALGWAYADSLSDKLAAAPHGIHPFHWPIEFPEVFDGADTGFDCIVGNPPFAGKNTITKGNRAGYLNWLKIISPGAHGNADLVAHFFRRAYGLLKDGGTMGLIATNTIGQGDTRESGLRYLLQDEDGQIYRAQRRVKWPGAAAVVVSTLHIGKGKRDDLNIRLDGRDISRISAFVREGDFDETPAVLEANKGIAFQGSIILGMGFTFDDANAEKDKATPIAEMHRLIAKDPRNAERIKPYLGGSEVNTDPAHKHHRYVIDFEDFPLRRDDSLELWAETSDKQHIEMLRNGVVPRDYNEPVAADWPDLLDIVERLVKPERANNKQWDRRELWWRFTRRTDVLYATLDKSNNDFCYAILFTSQFPNVAKLPKNVLFANSLNVFCSDDDNLLGVLQSRVHEIWAQLMSSSMKDDLRYTPTDCFQNFPIVQNSSQNNYLTSTVQQYLEHRKSIMVTTALGLTKTYNRFHEPLDHASDIAELRQLHAAMDDAVLRAYGWDDLAEMCQDGGEAAPRFLHKTDEPEFAYQKRYHWPAWFRDKVLARLLALNKERALAEQTQGKLTEKKTAPALQLDIKGSLL